MSLFDTYLAVDWSGGKDRGLKPKADAIWIGEARGADAQKPVYHRNRALAEAALGEVIDATIKRGQRAAIGFDFPFGYPTGFAQSLIGSADPLALWDWLETRIEDDAQGNNRFDVAASINAQFDGVGPFWGNGLKRDIAHLPRKGNARTSEALPERRAVERVVKSAFTCWQLSGAGAVGSQVLMGLPVLARLRRKFPGQIAVWPFEALDKPIAFLEIYPSLLDAQVKAALARDGGIKDAHQVRLTAAWMAQMDGEGRLGAALEAGAQGGAEGWILGAGLDAPEPPGVPRLRNDCFALPAGVQWTPVEDALNRLEGALAPVVAVETVDLGHADGRVLAGAALAQRPNPPAPNSAVDGYGFAHGSLTAGAQSLPLAEGRAAAGAPYSGTLPPGSAIRILTGARLPRGVDCVVLEEDCQLEAGHVRFAALPKPGANTRKAGEDFDAGAVLLDAGHQLRPPDLALLSASGLARVEVFRPLRVGVVSTGDELVMPGAEAGPDMIHDANRPMLLSLVARWGHRAVDLGHVGDDRDALRGRLDAAASTCDAILTSGGASAGDEDHVSALLRSEGRLSSWRIALKPGRPLVLAQWLRVPVFGLPGNPVAAFVCALLFARPALSKLSGAGFVQPTGFVVPAAFSKKKKAGRREYLRARLTGAGAAEVFASEGSGRISGLSWATGLVELPDEGCSIAPGDPVRFLPYAGFGI